MAKTLFGPSLELCVGVPQLCRDGCGSILYRVHRYTERGSIRCVLCCGKRRSDHMGNRSVAKDRDRGRDGRLVWVAAAIAYLTNRFRNSGSKSYMYRMRTPMSVAMTISSFPFLSSPFPVRIAELRVRTVFPFTKMRLNSQN